MKKKKIKIFGLLFLFSIFYFLFSYPGFAFAQAEPSASLYFLPSSGSIEVGKTFSLRLTVNTGENPVNLVDATLSFSQNTLATTGLSKAGSIINFWFNEPTFSNADGTISFSGGIPNPGFTGVGKILTINFITKAAGQAWIKFSSAQVLANDGFGTNILASSGQANLTLTGPGLAKPTVPKEKVAKIKISSSTHPDPVKWYKEKNIILNWSGPTGIINYSYLFDQKSDTVPDNISEGSSTSAAFLDTPEGIWYFHLKAKTATGWLETSHFRIKIDTTPPIDLEISSDEGSKTYHPSPTIRFMAKDELSGIDHFTIKINENEPVKVKENYYQLPKQKPGNYLITVRAYDQADNALEKNFSLTIEPIPMPRITYWIKQILVGEVPGNLIVRGVSVPGAKIKFYLTNEMGQTNIFETKTKEDGKWGLAIKELLLPGKYQGYALAEIGGETSPPSQKNEIKVVKTGLRFIFWIIPAAMIWGLIIALVCGLGILFILYLGIRRKFQKCDVFVRKILAIKDKEKKIKIDTN